MIVRRRWMCILTVILVVGSGLRLWGCFGQGYPFSFYPDEVSNVKRALRFGSEQTLDPAWFNKPALGYYVLFGEYSAYYGLGRLLDSFASVDDFAIHYLINPGPFYLIGRISTSLLGVLTLLYTWRLGRALGGRTLGLMSMIALLVTVGHITSGQHVKMDVPAAFFTTACAVSLCLVMMRGSRGDYVWSGVFGGLGMATKYYALGLFPLFLYAHCFRRAEAAAAAPHILCGRLWAGVLAFMCSFFLGSPYNFLSPKWFVESLKPRLVFVLQRLGIVPQEAASADPGGPLVSPGHDTIWDSVAVNTSQIVSPTSLGLLLTGLAVLGLLVALFRGGRRQGFILVMVITYALFVAVCNDQFTTSRHLSVLYPLIAVASAQGFLWLWGHVRPRGGGGPLAPVLALAVLLCLPAPGFPLWESVASNFRNTASDPRNVALDWVHAEVPSHAVIINDHGTLPLHPNERRCTWALERVEELRQSNVIPTSSLFVGLSSKWSWEREAVSRRHEPVYDTIELLQTWQTSALRLRRDSTQGYNPLWPRSPLGLLLDDVINYVQARPGVDIGPVDVRNILRALLEAGERDRSPVELWTEPSQVSLTWLTPHNGRGAPKKFFPAQWFVTTMARLDNKHNNFADFEGFYEDLEAHYARYVFGHETTDPTKRVCLFDLRRRYLSDPPKREVWK